MHPYSGDESNPPIALACSTLADVDDDVGLIGPFATIGAPPIGAITGSGGAYNTPSIITHSLYGAHHVVYQIMTPISSLTMIVIGGSTPSTKGVYAILST